ncbi:MAG: DNA translocase FtsK 4TM domain-containing protein, partial [Candidatus Kapabacteria bacterium]|nr:DNA translocase FtsK 4TM domain-containing protein [Candidatus Kapabacteria bacterium]MDW7996786.1 DNA translocase FtsK 4TM domain-containing protein [Bacteroidota bacterium]
MRTLSSEALAGRERRGRGGVAAQHRRRQRLLSVLLALTACFLLLALLSYTPEDYPNASISWGDLVGLVRGDPDARLKAETTQNWLGLLGAVLAHACIVMGTGYFVIVLPLLLGWWSWELFRNLGLRPLVWQRSLTV